MNGERGGVVPADRHSFSGHHLVSPFGGKPYIIRFVHMYRRVISAKIHGSRGLCAGAPRKSKLDINRRAAYGQQSR